MTDIPGTEGQDRQNYTDDQDRENYTVSKLKCDNCDWTYESADELYVVWPNIPDLGERLEPGGIVPAGMCNICGALVYPV